MTTKQYYTDVELHRCPILDHMDDYERRALVLETARNCLEEAGYKTLAAPTGGRSPVDLVAIQGGKRWRIKVLGNSIDGSSALDAPPAWLLTEVSWKARWADVLMVVLLDVDDFHLYALPTDAVMGRNRITVRNPHICFFTPYSQEPGPDFKLPDIDTPRRNNRPDCLDWEWGDNLTTSVAR